MMLSLYYITSHYSNFILVLLTLFITKTVRIELKNLKKNIENNIFFKVVNLFSKQLKCNILIYIINLI